MKTLQRYLLLLLKAIFALGNLALAMNEHDATELLAVETVVDLSNSVNAAMSDSNDKVRCRRCPSEFFTSWNL